MASASSAKVPFTSPKPADGSSIFATKVSFNCDSNRVVDWTSGFFYYMFPEFRFSKRVDLHCSIVEKYIADGHILEYFELLANEETDKLIATIKKHGYEVIVTPYNKDDDCFIFLFAYDPTVYSVEFVKSIYFTTSGDSLTKTERSTLTKEEQIAHGYGAQFEKSAVVYRVTNIATGKMIYMSTVHMALQDESKIFGSEELERFSHTLDAPLVVSGDWNTFPFSGKTVDYLKPMFEPIKKAVYNSFTDMIVKGEYSTFRANAYDYLRWFTKEEFQTFVELITAGNDAMRAGDEKTANEKFEVVRTMLEKVQKMKLETATVGIDGLGEHSTPENTCDSGILDLVVIYDATKSGITADTHVKFHDGASDHGALESSIYY